MKAPAFDYARPDSLGAVFALMAEHGDGARLLAGGQTLLATLNMRLSEPALLIDINRVEALKGIAVEGDTLRIGALVTHRVIEESPVIARHAPLMTLAAPHIAHRAIRNRGTLGGSVAYADPSAEWPVCLAALDGVVVVRNASTERRIPVREFFIDLYATALEPDELIVACEVPVAHPGDFFVFDELARRHGDYAITGLAMAARRGSAGIERMRLAYLGVGTVPFRPLATEAMLEGRVLDDALVEAAIASLRDELDPMGDMTSSGETKRHLACVLTRRALKSAMAEVA